MAGGDIDLSACPELPGLGHLAAAPDFELTLSGNAGAGRTLVLSAQGGCDTTLLVNDANGVWHFNDDGEGLDPLIEIANAPDGLYDIWIGTVDTATCNATLTLAAATPVAPVTPGLCPDWSLDSPVADRGADALARGESFQLSARGATDLAQCGFAGAVGHVEAAPALELNLTGNRGQDLVIAVTAPCDTVLLVNDPAGQYLFNDDAESFDPALTIPAAADGVYDIWVGGYDAAGCDATLTLRMIGAQAAPPGGGKTPPAQQPAPAPVALTPVPASGNLMDFAGQVGQVLSFEVTGAADGRVWGTDVYTADSTLATAAVHAGVLSPGQRGVVTVRIEPGQPAYQGSERNGIASGSWGTWSLSYSFLRN